MAVEGGPMANPFVHVELNTTDLTQAKTFYEKLFDWKMQDIPMPQGSYTMIDVGEGTGGGMMKQLMPGQKEASYGVSNACVEGLEVLIKK
jgi:predicted enzyme related to lactoylglutathione lyase